MVARENTETAGIIRNRLVKTKLGGKIGDRIFNCAPRSSLSVSVVSSQIFLEFLKNLLQIAQERFVLREVFQTRLPRKLQHATGLWLVLVHKSITRCRKNLRAT